MSYGMRLRFRDAKCDYEEDYMFDVVDFTYTKTDKKAISASFEEGVPEEGGDKEDLDYQDYLASFYAIRSSRKATGDEEKQNLTALAWEEYEGTDLMGSEVTAGSGLAAINGSESTNTSNFLETRITPLPRVKAETSQSNHTSVAAEEDLILASTSDGKAELVFENRSQNNYEIDRGNMSAGELLLSNGEGQMNIAEELPADGKDSAFFSEKHEEESAGRGNYNINRKRKRRNSLAIKFYSIQKMNDLLNHVRNKNVSFSDKTNATHSVHHAENTSDIDTVASGHLPNDYDDEVEDEETKEESGTHAVNLTLALDLSSGDGSNTSSVSEPNLSKDKQANAFSLDHTLDNIGPNSNPALVKNLLEVSLPRAGKYSSKMTDEEWNLVSAKESLGLEENVDKPVSGKLNHRGRNGTAFKNKQHIKKYQVFSPFLGEKQKGRHMHSALKGKEWNKNATLSTSGTFIRIRRKKKEYPKMTHSLSPRSKKPQEITNSVAEFGRTLLPGETNRTTLPCCTNTTGMPSEANRTADLSRARHGESLNYTLTPRQLRPSITIGLPQADGDYEYVTEGSFGEETSGDEYEYHYVSFDDPYMTDPKVNIYEQRNPENIAEHYLRSKGNERRYYIAAKEICWNYAGSKKRFG